MARMGGGWPRWAGPGTKVTRLKVWRINELGWGDGSKSPPSRKKRGKDGAPAGFHCARVRRKLLGSCCGLIVEADSFFLWGIHEPFPFCRYCRAIRTIGRG